MLINLIEWENKSGYKAKYIAEKLGITESQYSKLKNGKRRPTIEDAYNLQKEFDIEDVITLLREVTADEE